MKPALKIIILLSLTVTSIILHNLINAFWGLEEPLFFSLTFVFSATFLIYGLYLIFTALQQPDLPKSKKKAS